MVWPGSIPAVRPVSRAWDKGQLHLYTQPRVIVTSNQEELINKKTRTMTRLSSIIVSESDILGPIDYFSGFENLVPFESAMFEDYSFKYRTKIFRLFMLMSPL